MADGFDDEVDTEPTISIGDYLKSVEEEELEADLVLGGDEGKECTYNKGYIKRQAIFSCLTCTPDGNAGVCTACSLSCHEGHEILELWTKRNFRCDCGNSKFGEFVCKLFAGKDVENADNVYNHNFKGTYCTCDLPYPDPNVEEQVEMIQCCICEDWFHEEHIGLQSNDKIPRDEEGEPLYEDFICQVCVGVCSFLTYYAQITSAPDPSDTAKELAVLEKDTVKEKAVMENDTVKEEPVLEKETVKEEAVLEKDTVKEKAVLEMVTVKEKAVLEKSPLISLGKVDNGNCSFESSVSNTNSGTAPEEDNVDGVAKKCAEVGGPSTKCILGDLVGNLPMAANSRPLFLSRNWRELLCRCEKCSDLYAQRGVSFLLDKEDSIAEYERMAKQKRNENMQKQEGAEMNFLNNLGHVEKMEILNGIADMKNEIFSLLESSDPSKPITTADIQQVFENLSKKRKRMA